MVAPPRSLSRHTDDEATRARDLPECTKRTAGWIHTGQAGVRSALSAVKGGRERELRRQLRAARAATESRRQLRVARAARESHRQLRAARAAREMRGGDVEAESSAAARARRANRARRGGRNSRLRQPGGGTAVGAAVAAGCYGASRGGEAMTARCGASGQVTGQPPGRAATRFADARQAVPLATAVAAGAGWAASGGCEASVCASCGANMHAAVRAVVAGCGTSCAASCSGGPRCGSELRRADGERRQRGQPRRNQQRANGKLRHGLLLLGRLRRDLRRRGGPRRDRRRRSVAMLPAVMQAAAPKGRLRRELRWRAAA
jgi:hypothetical protein